MIFKNYYFFIYCFNSFFKNNCHLRAAALTFYTLLSIVPVLALAFGIAKGFGLEKHLEHEILENFPNQEQIISQFIEFARSILAQTEGEVIAGTGILVLFWSVIQLLSNIEGSLNVIWNVTTARSWKRKIGDYLSAILIGPFLLLTSSSLTVLVKSRLLLFFQGHTAISPASDFVLWGFQWLPIVLIWLLFTFTYWFLPNTQVSIKAALIAGIVCGSAYQVMQWLYVTFQIGTARYGAIYGSFAALPLFLIWLHISWYILLFGAEMAHAIQGKIGPYCSKFEISKISSKSYFLCALYITYQSVQRFLKGQNAVSALELAKKMTLPLNIIELLLNDLTAVGILAAVYMSKTDEWNYQPAMNLERLSIAKLKSSLENNGASIEEFIAKDSEFSLFLKQVTSQIEFDRKEGNLLLIKDI
ncbi:MAG: putative ribonuclease [Chlamydiales bacterium]|jgi:membrane protein|nr:putative ribonuclease [Chlamydiales bacterium]